MPFCIEAVLELELEVESELESSSGSGAGKACKAIGAGNAGNGAGTHVLRAPLGLRITSRRRAHASSFHCPCFPQFKRSAFWMLSMSVDTCEPIKGSRVASTIHSPSACIWRSLSIPGRTW